MNRLHGWLCRSARWRETIAHRVPWVLSGTEFGHHVLELGPGPGLTTDLLRRELPRLTALEIDPVAADALRVRMGDGNVEVVTGDGTAMAFSDATFSGAVALTMLHHVPSPALQDALLREVCRVLEPGASFVGSDSLPNLRMWLLHIGDTFVPVSPDSLATRLDAAGFDTVTIDKRPDAFRFHARKRSTPNTRR